MRKFLVATVPLTGHVEPMRMLVTELVKRGHDAAWHGASKFRERIEAAGARFVPPREGADWDDADIATALPALRGKRGLARVKTQLREMFIAPLVGQLHDLEAAAASLDPDVIIADSAHLGAMAFSEKHGVPLATLGVSALVFPSEDTAPFGSALPPDASVQGKRRNRMLNRLIFRGMFHSVNKAFRRELTLAGLEAGKRSYFEVMSSHLYLQPTVPSFEYPRSDLPSQVKFIGPMVNVDPPQDWQAPSWWPDVLDAERRATPIVVVSQGTLATEPSELILPTVRALARLNVLVIATTGRPPAEALPDNTRAAAYIPYGALFSRAAAFITNGGYGGVQMALRAGVPLVVAGGSEEKPEIAARVAWSGAGINLRTGRPSEKQIAQAVARLLSEADFRQRASAIRQEMLACDAPRIAADEIERLAERA